MNASTVLDKLTASNIFDLRGVVAVVTGGGTGIGLMISTTLLANGATVYIVGPEQEKLDSITRTYNEAAANRGGKFIGLQGDVRLKDEAKRIAEEIAKREGHVTVLFNNAGVSFGGVGPPPGPTASASQIADHYWKVKPEDFDNTLSVNSVGAYWFSLAFLPLLEKWKSSEGGKKFAPQIVMTSSMNGWTKDPATCAYSFPYLFSKSAIGHFTGTLAHELLPTGIRVNGIAPGLFITEMTSPGTADAVGQSHAPASRPFGFEVPAEQAEGAAEFRRAGTNRDMGSLALFLVANWFVNGETVLIDGGTLLKHPSSY